MIKMCTSRLNFRKILSMLFAFNLIVFPSLSVGASNADEVVLKHDVMSPADEIVTVKGVITDALTQEPMYGVSVVEKGTTNGTITDLEGNFTVKVAVNKTVVISFIGYKTQEVIVTAGMTTLNIQLEEDVTMLGEVVAIGYGSSRKEDLSMAISTVKVDQSIKSQTPSLGNLLQGRMPGVTFQSNGGDPLKEGSVAIRGKGSMNGDAILYVVDGVPGAPYNVEDVETITVLKDAASAAIYGSNAGSGGVVIITTKQGAEGKVKIDLNLSNGFKTATNLPESLTAEEYNMVYRKASELNGSPLSAINDPSVFPWGNVTRTNWMDEIFRTAYVQHYAMSISGGSKDLRGFASVSYDKEEGTLINTWAQKINAKMNIDAQLTNWLKLSQRASFRYQTGQGNINESHEGPFIEALQYPRSATVYEYDKEGNLVYDDKGNPQYGGLYPTWAANDVQGYGNLRNPVAELMRRRQHRPTTTIYSTTSLEAKPISRLTLRSDFTAGRENERVEEFLPRYLEIGRQQLDNSKSIDDYVNTNWLWESTATYAENFADKHDISLMAGYSMDYKKYHHNYIQVYGFESEDELHTLLGNATNSMTDMIYGETINQATQISGFARAAYSFDDRYFLIGSARKDASSKLPKNNRADMFYAASAAWKLSSEPFFKNLNLPFIDLIKFRGSWGQTGSVAMMPFIVADKVRMKLSDHYNAMGDGGSNNVLGIYPQSNINPNLRWETTNQTTFGVDLTLFDKSLDISVDYYSKDTEDLIHLGRVSKSTGVEEAQYANMGKVNNKGWEFTANYSRKIGDLSFNVFGNLSTLKNEVIHLGGLKDIQHSEYTYRSLIPLWSTPGESWYSFKVYETLGIFKSQDEVNSYLHKDPVTGQTTMIQPDAKPGDFIKKDANGDGKIDDKDKVYKGSHQPKITYSLGAGVNYKNFDFSFMLQGVGGNKIYNVYRQMGVEGANENNMLREVLDSWTFNPESNFPRLPMLTGSGSNNYTQELDFFLENSSYLRLKNIVLGYTLPKQVMHKIGLPTSNIRLYVSGENLATFTSYKGVDPEVGNNGIDASTYPLAKTFTVGLNLNF